MIKITSPYSDTNQATLQDVATSGQPINTAITGGNRVAMLLSGGVDSSVALRLLLDQGYQVTAFYLKIWLEDELAYLGSCPWEEDLDYVRKVCEQAKVPLEVISLQKEYHDMVVSYTLSEVKSGRTPNPDILCNSRIKFGAFYAHIDSLKVEQSQQAAAERSYYFDYVASGHYAQKLCQDGEAILAISPDAVKDQTYFLSGLTQEQLRRALFPIGMLVKAQVRELAHRYNLPNKTRKDSQGICFLGKLKFSDFLRHHIGEKQGDLIEHETGKIIGTHNGFWFYTIGQRQGLGLAGGPWYVVAKNPTTNTVRISKEYYAEAHVRDTFIVQNMHWINQAPDLTQNIQVKLRHGAKKYICTLTAVSLDVAGCSAQSYRVQLAERDQGIAPGQFAVFYQDNICLGSGVIHE